MEEEDFENKAKSPTINEDESQIVDWESFELHPLHRFESFRSETIVAGDIPPIDQDWTAHFTTNTVFKSREKLKQWIKEVGRNNKMSIVIKKSNFKGRNPRILFGCERSGTYRPTKKGEKDGTSIPEKNVKVPISRNEKKWITGTIKCECPFEIKAIQHAIVDDAWIIDSVRCGRHNHLLSPYIEGHAYHARHTSEEKEVFANLSKGGVKPKQALGIMKTKFPENSSSLQTLYNAKKQMHKEERDGRTEFQQLAKDATNAGYVMHDRRDYETDVVVDFLFAHPDSISLAKCFPYIFVMDATYSTNVYHWPLFEIVGITSTWMTFSVCFCFMERETTDHFIWVLKIFKELLGNDQVPLSIVTDRELALMNALQEVFPDTYHLLCRWHIGMGVDNKGKSDLPKEEDEKKDRKEGKTTILPDGVKMEKGWQAKLKKKWRDMWDEVVFSRTIEDYEANLVALQENFMQWPSLYEFACTWLVYKEKFVSVWTDQVFHVGNNSTNRVEGAHSSLKNTLMHTSKQTFLSMYNLINTSLRVQMAEIKKSFTQSLNIQPHVTRIAFFKNVRGYASLSCLKILRKEYDKYLNGYAIPGMCRCSLRLTHGLPCACQMGPTIMAGGSLELVDVHDFWKKLSVVPRRVEFDELELQVEFQLWVQNYKNSSSDQKKYLLRRLREDSHRQTTWLNTPLQRAQGKGRPSAISKTKKVWSTKRDPSAFEREVPIIPTPPQVQYYSLGTPSMPVHQTKKAKKSKGYNMYKGNIPHHYDEFVADILDVAGDGNCGFRAIAAALGMCSKEGWKQVREDCVMELDNNADLYARQWGGTSVAELRSNIDHYHSPTKGVNYWMLMPETAYVIANCYGVVVVYMTRYNGHTFFCSFLPQRKSPPPLSIGEVPIISLMQVPMHYLCVKLMPLAPIPPPTTFSVKYRQSNVIGWDEHLERRITKFNSMFKGLYVLDENATDLITIDD